jgi:PAS domain S-box-containing protein
MRSFLDTSVQAEANPGRDGDLAASARRISGVSSAHFLKLVEERGTTGFWTCDLLTGQCTCSPGLPRVMGRETPQSFRILDLLDQVHPEDRSRCEDLWPLIRSGVPVNRSFRIIRGDRTVRWVEFRSEVVLDAEQRPVRAIGLLQDVSQEQETRQTLDESLGRYRALVGAVATMEWRATATGEPVFSHGWTALTGQRESDVLSGNWVNAIHPDDRAAVVAAWQYAVANLTPYEANHRILKADGEYEWYQARAVPILHKNGRPHEWLGMIIRRRDFSGFTAEQPAVDATLTPTQIRAGRAMLQWTLEDLSRESGVSISSIRRIEGEGERSTRPTSLSAIRQAFERQGLLFGDGNGVSLQARKSTRA